MLSQVQGNSGQSAPGLPPIYGYRSAGQSNNGEFKHESVVVTGLQRDGWTRMKDETMTKSE